MLIIASILEIIYAIYMYIFFKTKYSCSNELNNSIMSKNISQFFKHSIITDNYESKICPFGKLFSILFSLYIFFRMIYILKYGYTDIFRLINTILIIVVAILSYILNANAFLYYIPIYFYELFLLPILFLLPVIKI